MTTPLPQTRREWLLFTAGALVVLFGAVIFQWWQDAPSQPWNLDKGDR